MKAEIRNLCPDSTAVLEPNDDCMICLMALRTGMEKEGVPGHYKRNKGINEVSTEEHLFQ